MSIDINETLITAEKTKRATATDRITELRLVNQIFQVEEKEIARAIRRDIQNVIRNEQDKIKVANNTMIAHFWAKVDPPAVIEE